MASPSQICSSFVEAAPPGELTEVVNDIKALTSDDDPALVEKLKPAFQKYNEDQLVAVKLPGGSQHVLISSHNRLSDSSYFDTTSSTSFTFDHLTQKASGSQSYTHDSPHSDLVSSVSRALGAHFAEHYPPSANTTTAAFTVCPSTTETDRIAILLSTLKASPSNFLSGRWRSTFLYNPSAGTLSGNILINVHYYEDGNVALTTRKTIPETPVEANGDAIAKKVAALEKQYQEEVNRGFVGMNEGMFKGLRRQLPVTRQRVEWEKVRGYGLGADLKGDGKR